MAAAKSAHTSTAVQPYTSHGCFKNVQAQCFRNTNCITSINVYHKDIIQLDTWLSPVLALGSPSGLVQTFEDVETSLYLGTIDCVCPAPIKNIPIHFWSFGLALAGHSVLKKTEHRQTSTRAEIADMRQQHDVSAGNANA